MQIHLQFHCCELVNVIHFQRIIHLAAILSWERKTPFAWYSPGVSMETQCAVQCLLMSSRRKKRVFLSASHQIMFTKEKKRLNASHTRYRGLKVLWCNWKWNNCSSHAVIPTPKYIYILFKFRLYLFTSLNFNDYGIFFNYLHISTSKNEWFLLSLWHNISSFTWLKNMSLLTWSLLKHRKLLFQAK